jgi:branched-chain amino acid transport system permease protein
MQILINSTITGLITAVMALAFTAVYLPTRVFYIALGGVYTLVPFIVWTELQWGWPWYIAALLASMIGVALSLSCELVNHVWLEKKAASNGIHLISSLGIYIIVVQAIAIIWGNDTKVLRQGIDSTINFGETTLGLTQISGAIISIVALAAFYLWLYFSNLGLQFRALADNPNELALRGYNIHHIRLIAFGVSGLLASISSLVTAWDVGFDPHGGLVALLVAIVASIIGGRQSFWGAALGGIMLGVVRAQIVWFLSSQWQEALTFLILAIFLLLRPQGLIGQTHRLESET